MRGDEKAAWRLLGPPSIARAERGHDEIENSKIIEAEMERFRRGLRASSPAKERRNGSTSVTRPIVWNVPRSPSLITVAGLMSTQTTFTQAGSRLPVAIECSAVAIRSAKPTPWIASRIRSWATSESVITSGSGPSSRIEPASTTSTPALTHSYMIPEVSDTALDRPGDPARSPDGVDRSQMVLMTMLDRLAERQRNAQARAEQRLLDVVGGQRIAREEHLHPALPDQPGDLRRRPGVHDRRATHQQHLLPFGTSRPHGVDDGLHADRLWASRSRPSSS